VNNSVGWYVGSSLTMAVESTATIAIQLAVAGRPGLDLDERLTVLSNGNEIDVDEIVGADGGRQHVLVAPPGPLVITYDAQVTRMGAAAPEPVTVVDRITALRPSRYCPSDRMAGYARRFTEGAGGLADDAQRVRAICDHVARSLLYEAESSDTSTDAVDTLLTGRGVCRDYAHLVAALCRAVDVPARVVAVYAPGLFPMDFHAVVETAIDGAWWVWDATRLAPRPTLIRIGAGRDAADIAFATVFTGRADLSTVEITAVAPGDLPLDDHHEQVALS
jgi:transglutaminase-like putative cysteine protease